MLDPVAGAVRGGDGELLRRRGDRGHRGAEQRAELDRRKAHAASGAEHDQLLSRLKAGDRAQDVVRGAVRHAEGGGQADVDAARDATDRLGGDDRLLGEGADEHRCGDDVADHDVAHALPELFDDACELAPRDERRGRRHLVLVRDDEDVGEVQRRGDHPHAHLARARHGLRHVLHADGLGRPIAAADGGAHVRAFGRGRRRRAPGPR
jgi:hypothetical protein